MITWGAIVFIGLVLIFWDLNPVTKARLMGSPLIIHVIVIGSGLAIHGSSADGAMAAIASGVFSALYVRYQRKINGYIKRGVWFPGSFKTCDPRIANGVTT
jgi:hypothetical protein